MLVSILALNRKQLGVPVIPKQLLAFGAIIVTLGGRYGCAVFTRQCLRIRFERKIGLAKALFEDFGGDVVPIVGKSAKKDRWQEKFCAEIEFINTT